MQLEQLKSSNIDKCSCICAEILYDWTKGALQVGNISSLDYRRTHGLQTYVQRPWLIVSVNLAYSFNVHA